jgi:hypothetical protein
MTENRDLSSNTEPGRESDSSVLSRRRFLGGVGSMAAAAVAGGAVAPLVTPAPAQAQTSDVEAFPTEARGATPAEIRREKAFQSRYNTALWHRNQPIQRQDTNGDEGRHPAYLGNYSKALPHNSFGEVDPGAYQQLMRAAQTGNPDDYEAIPTSGARRLTSPQAGLAFDTQGADAWHFAVPPAPALGSAQAAAEAVELYWMAVLRDVNFLDYHNHPLVGEAVADLNRMSDFRGPKRGGKVTPQTLFRDPFPGALKGPYISQFMWMGTQYGAEYVERRMRTYLPDSDHLTSYSEWLDAQNGVAFNFVNYDPVRRYIRNGRDLAEWAHNDVLFQAYFNACLILGHGVDDLNEPTHGGINCPMNPGNPYLRSRNQAGFTTFGGPHIKTLLCEVSTRALKATWYQKWQVHRRLRPEAYGGRVHNQLANNRYPGLLHGDVLNSAVVQKVFSKNGTYLLPQAFPEGAPTHPSYTAGHATVAGACVTILKAFYDESFPIYEPVMPTPDGLALVRYDGPGPLTVGGELNKLAINIAHGRNLGGVHWRSDATQSMLLGEKIAISILRDQKGCYNERFDGFTFTKFDGTKITI